MKSVAVVAWHNQGQLDAFKYSWNIKPSDPVIFQQDKFKQGCAVTKNAGIKAALETDADIICVLDDDCYPAKDHPYENIRGFLLRHERALQPQMVQRVVSTTIPNSRGTPYYHIHLRMPVAASLGFWTHYPDFDAIAALQLGPTASVKYNRRTIFGDYFPFCGMNYAFPRKHADLFVHVDVPRFDDIWMGWIAQKVAYERNLCFNLQGPDITHSRQSDVWKNLREEAPNMEYNEYLWSHIATAPYGLSPKSLRDKYVSPLLSSGVGSSPSQRNSLYEWRQQVLQTP